MLEIRLLGQFEIRQAGHPVRIPLRPAQALLAYLLLNPDLPHRREKLAGLFWPDLPETAARSNLRHALWRIRKALGASDTNGRDFLRADEFTVAFDPQSDLWLDTRVLEQPEQTPTVGALTHAAEVYRGELLPGFYDDWVCVERERLQAAFENKMAQLLEALAAAGRWEDVLAWGERWIAFGRTPEAAYRALITAHGQQGNASQAAAAYRRCVEALQRDLGVEPSAQTRLAYERALKAPADGAQPVSLPLPALRGYELRERIGSGANGVVYRGYQPSVERTVAIKVIAPEHADRPDFIRRFEAEARLVARLEHPHIVPLYDYWREPGGAYLVMRWLKGGNLREAMPGGAWQPEAAARLVEQICAALMAAHRQGVVHRDVKPENILLDDAGNAYLSDFGIATDLAGLTAAAAPVRGSSAAYASPELTAGGSATAQSDLYSLGVTLREVLAPAPEAVQAVLACATRTDPSERYPSALAFAAAFRRAAAGQPEVEGAERPEAEALVNPYKGLRPFEAADAANFFGREALIDRLLCRMRSDDPLARFLAVVGPSGCGKSSVVKAGLLPALRRGALPGSEGWYVVEMTPGAHPLEELEIALLRVARERPAGLMEQLRRDARGLARAARLALPEAGAQLLLVIDQFEEVFTRAVDPQEIDHLLRSLAAAVTEPDSPVRVLITLRADFYDRPLLHGEFSALMRERTEALAPMTADELARAIRAPAERAGAEVEPDLEAALVADVVDEPGSLPMLEYALTEVFERREGRRLTLEAYHALGGASGALARRADDVYGGLSTAEQATARQAFLRLVTLGEGVEDTRRRVLVSELQSMAAAGGGLAAVLEAFGRHRLLTFDRDPATRTPTVELAHEALLREWGRLRGWLDEGRAEVRQQRQLARGAEEWAAAGRSPSDLLRGARLAQVEEWARGTSLALTEVEREYLAASAAERERLRAEEQARQAREARLEQRARRVLRALVGVFLAAAVVAGGLALWANSQRQAAVANLALSEAQRLAAESKTLILEGRDAPTAALLALRSLALHYTPQGDEALSQALYLDYPVRAFVGHTSALWSGGFLPGDDVIYTTSNDNEGSIRLWQVATGEVLRSFDVEGGCFEARPSPDGKLLAAGCLDGLAYIWAMGTGREVYRFEHGAVDNPRVRFSPDGGQLLTCGTGVGARLWSLKDGQLVREFAATESAIPGITGIAFTPNGDQVVGGGDDLLVHLWDAATGAEIRTFVGHTDRVWGVDVSPDGRYLVSSSNDSGGARLWDLATGQELRRFVQVSSMSYEIAFAPDGRHVITGGLDNTARVWEVQTGREVRRFTHPNAAMGLAFSSDGRYALTTAWDQVARLWEVAPEAGLPRYPALESPAYGAISVDGRMLAVSSVDNIVRLWDTQTGRELCRLAGHTGPIWDIAFSPDGRYLVTGSWSDATTRAWDVEACAALWTNASIGGQSIAFSPDGRKLMVAAGTNPGLYDAVTGQLVQSIVHSEGVFYAAHSPDGATAATSVGSREDVFVWDTAVGQIVRTFNPDAGDVIRALVYSPDGKYLAAGGNTGTLYLWDAATGEEVQRFVGHTNMIERALAYSPDGRYLASGSFDRTARIWDVASGQEVRRLAGYADGVDRVAFTPDGRLLLTISYDGTVRMTYVRLQDAIDDLCRRQLRDFLPDERERYGITDASPTCPQP